MKTVLCLCLFTAFGSMYWSQEHVPPTSPKAEQEILRLEEERCEAILHNDAAAMQRLLADEFIVTDVQGKVHDKADEVALYKDARRQTESWDPSEVKVRVYGDMAVVTQRAAVKDVLEGDRRDVQLRLTHVWVERDGRWQAIARHATRISKPPQSTPGVTPAQPDKLSPSSSLPNSFSELSHSSEAEMEIHRVREQSRRAFLEGDYDTLDRLWADDYYGITTWGEIRTKAESLQGLRKGDRKFLSLDYDEIKVRVYGNAAIETGRVRYWGLSGGQKIPGNAHYILVFIKQSGQWRLVAQQASNIASNRLQTLSIGHCTPSLL